MEGKFKNVDKEAWFEMIKNGPPMKNLKKREVVKELGPNKRIIHLEIAMPIMTNREQVIEWSRTEVNDKESLLMIRSVLCDEVPIKDNIIRAQFFKAALLR